MKKPQRRATPQGYRQPFEAYGNGTPENSAEHPQDHLAPKRGEWHLDAERIVQKLNCHKSFTIEDGRELKNLPPFSDMTNYQISEAEQFRLWTLETNRLVNIVNAGNPIELEGLDEWFGMANGDGYDRLHKLATQLRYASSICSTDNELILLEFEPMDSNPNNFRNSRAHLLRRFGPEGTIHSAKDSIQLIEENNRCYQALVNYVTGTVIQVLLRVMEGEFWDHNVVIAMAKLAAKIKIVGFDLEKAATICLAGANDWDNRLWRQQKNDFPPPSSKDMSNPKDKRLSAAQRHISHEGSHYFQVMNAFTQCIDVLISHVATELISDQAAASTDSFEASCIVYDTGMLQQRSLLFQNRSGAIGGSANKDDVHCAGFAFEVCLEVLERLQERLPRKQHTESNSDSTPYTTVYWKWTQIITSKDGRDNSSSWGPAPQRGEGIQLNHPRTGTIHLTSMKDIITASVPFFILCGDFSSQLKPMLYRVHSLKNTGGTRTCEGDSFLASLVLHTSNYHVPTDSSVTSLSTSAIARKRALSEWNQPTTLGRSIDHVETHSQLRNQLRLENAEIASALKLIHSWVMDHKSIVIPYRWYCWGTLGLCGCLIFGGLAIGFSVHERIQGVDPFNISVFCWVLSGFLVLFFKSIRVQEWPWRDFFQGQVVCKSVSEVVAVSSINPQLLLSILLYLEPFTFLKKRGPFGTIFTREHPDDGFAIDVPLGTEALNMGGCFFVKVQSIAGPALICIRLNYNHPFMAISPRGLSKDKTGIKCRNLDTQGRWGKHPNDKPLYFLSTNEMVWTRVIGLHCEKIYFD